MRKLAAAVLVTGLFLLMLSALVVTPEDASPPVMPTPRQYHAVFMPPAEPPAPVSAGLPAQRTQAGLPFAAAAAVILNGWRAQGAHDSNGRVLSALRYENSVYEVFRPEVAGG